uniref:Heme biosynthesis protein n=1 Tax=Andalucia godoyi TaxID=505711 RepID=M4QCQ1_ANDGO|nr:heme biosynthesis protein [Andalucia godoyi]AGH23975.1 heme biosynthesis protein [Andalucia godoyi]
MRIEKKTIFLYLIAMILFMFALSYASVPLYRVFCQVTGYGGTAQILDYVPLVDEELPKRILTIRFNADVGVEMPWKFAPIQKEMKVLVGESALAFYEATNPTDHDLIGISTYNVTPQQAGIYFNKIQCFCFDEQMLKSQESIDMPVFFFIDPDFLEDPRMNEIDTITLSYTFFVADHA